jgi:hypothetical protein
VEPDEVRLTALFAAVLYGSLGLGLGILQFASLRENVRLYVEGCTRARAVLLHVARLAFAALGWLGLARLGGALALVSGLVGFLVARAVLTARIRRTA